MTHHRKPAARDRLPNRAGGGQSEQSSTAQVDVLVAENNETNKFYIESVLSTLGFSFKTVENGVAAVDAFRRLRPRIILMDIAMPLSDGVEATINIRRYEERNELAAVPIIALSANAIPGLKERYLAAGMNDSLLKPYSIDQINAMLNEWILPASAEGTATGSHMRSDMPDAQ